VDVAVSAAVVREVFEILVDAFLVSSRIGGCAGWLPVDDVVRVRRHHRPAVVIEVGEERVKWPKRGGPAQWLVAHGPAAFQVHDQGGGTRGKRRERRGREQDY